MVGEVSFLPQNHYTAPNIDLEDRSKDGFPSLVSGQPESSSSGFVKENSNLGFGETKWSNHLFVKKNLNEDCSLNFNPLVTIEGKEVPSISLVNYTENIKECESYVIGNFVGPRLSFAKVESASKKVWKSKSEVQVSLHGNNAFVFKFMNEEDRKFALDHGSFYIEHKLFIVRPWCPLIEKSITEMKTIPIWLMIYNVPLHLWNKLGLSSIASYIGNPLFMDEHTLNKTRLAYARVCVEISVDCSFPSYIPLWIDGVFVMNLPVEYQWKPPRCELCCSFGHASKNCVVDGVKRKMQWIPRIPNAGKVLVNNLENVGMSSSVETGSSVGPQEKPIILDVEKVPVLDVDLSLKISNENDDMNVIAKKKKRRSNKSKETLVIEEDQEVMKMDVDISAHSVKQVASTSSTDPSIPPGFENYNKFNGLGEEEEVATSKLQIEDMEMSTQNQSSSEPILSSSKKVTLKSKATGLFPNGTLSTKKNGSSKSLDTSNKISTNKLVEFGSEWGLSFPSSKQKCREMCSDVVKNHKHLSLEDIDESPS